MDYDPTLDWRDVRDGGFNDFIGPLRFVEYGRGDDGAPCAWQLALAVDDRHVNIGGVCHGGVVMATADVAMGLSAFHAAGRHRCATIDFNGHFLAAAKRDTWLVIDVRLNRLVRDLVFMQCDAFSAGRRCFAGRGIWKLLASGAPSS